jgi:hypothetical protein
MANQIVGAKAGGPRQLPLRTPLSARGGEGRIIAGGLPTRAAR